MIYTEFSVSASGTLHISWSYGPRFSADPYLPCLPLFLIFEILFPHHSTCNPVCVVWKYSFQRLRLSLRRKAQLQQIGTYGLFLLLLLVILQLITWHLGSVQKAPVLILVLGKNNKRGEWFAISCFLHPKPPVSIHQSTAKQLCEFKPFFWKSNKVVKGLKTLTCWLCSHYFGCCFPYAYPVEGGSL